MLKGNDKPDFFKSGSISIYYCNARSVNNKGDDLLLSTKFNVYDIITIAETWLCPGQKDGEFMDIKYKVFRTDRSDSAIEKEIGGGVLIAIRNEIDCERFISDEMSMH